MTPDESKLEILKKVEDGTLSIEEGADLLGILDQAETTGPSDEFIDETPPVDDAPLHEKAVISGCWKAAWSMILVGGAVLTAFSAFWIYQGYQKAGFGWGFFLSWIPFIIGVLFTIFGWILMESPWMQIKVREQSEKSRTNINIAIPVPIKLVSWLVRNFGQYMPEKIREKGVDEMMGEIEQAFSRGESLVVDVNDRGEGDEQVNVYFS
ncbi:MAG: hypothetical protein KBF64_00845 [Anaerolineaceae bacterium]|nr:hypothetical protein [Anaerolineaceae bacterium]